jgi:glucose-1-phosphate adenylyltransferase
MLAEGELLQVYRFESYWKDVGTIDSLWDANMDMLADHPELDLFESDWRIIREKPYRRAALFGRYAKISHSLITEGCEIYGTLKTRAFSQCDGGARR